MPPGAIQRAVLRRNEELTRVLMQLDANAREGIWPHRDATSAYTIAADREYSEIVATIEREEDNRRMRLSHDGTPSPRKHAAAPDFIGWRSMLSRPHEFVCLASCRGLGRESMAPGVFSASGAARRLLNFSRSRSQCGHLRYSLR
jgi:hypothetical protein